MQKNVYAEVVSSPEKIPANEKILEYLGDQDIGVQFARSLVENHERLCTLDSIELMVEVELIISDLDTP